MEVRITPDDVAYARMTTQELRSAFLLEDLFRHGRLSMVYCDSDRVIVGAAVPVAAPLLLEADRKEMAADYFNERRELGVVNVGGRGSVTATGASYTLDADDVLYLGRGEKDVRFSSDNPVRPAQFYFVSFPAHAAFPAALTRRKDAEAATIGSPSGASRRTIRRYIHKNGVQSCQLVMGITELDEGSVWNTMPPHTHSRRTEVYMYYGLPADALALHLMGKPEETRSLIVRDRQAVLSPGWSIHAAAGTVNYHFVWAMGGENQEYSDMDAADVAGLK
jgi:4-deoxy-L-threo-5-hexosulose-uronate ketol-isomerase